MTEKYREKLIQLAKELIDYRATTDCKDYTLLSKIDYLTGYIIALEGKGEIE